MTTSKSKKKPVRKAKPARQVHHTAPLKSSKAKKTPRAKMARTSKPEDPQQAPRVVFMPVMTQGTRVTEDNALTCSVVWACVKVISETIGALSWHVMEQLANGDKQRQYLSPVEWILHRQTNEEMAAGTFRETIVSHALLWGNGYAEIERDGAGRPLWMWPLSPDRMEVDRDAYGRLVYVYHHPTGGETEFSPREIFHLKGLSFDGLVGYQAVRMAAQSIGLALEMERNGAAFFANGSRPSGLLKYPGKTTPEILDKTEQRWTKLYGGSRNAHRVAAVDQGLEYVPIATSNVESQWNESRQAQVAEICRWFRVQPHKVMDLIRSTNNNIEHQSIEFVQDTILPWAKRLEQEADIKLFGQQRQGRFYTKLNIDSLLRGDITSRSQFYQMMLDRAVFSPNDIRGMEDLNSIGKDGDKRFVQSNMTTLEKAGTEPVAPAPAPRPAAPVDDEADDEDGTDMHHNRLNGHGVN